MTKSSLLEARVLALVWAVAAVVVARADGALHGGADACVATTAAPTVGAVMRIFHTSLYVRGRYVGAAPCYLVSGDTLSTDTRGRRSSSCPLGVGRPNASFFRSRSFASFQGRAANNAEEVVGRCHVLGRQNLVLSGEWRDDPGARGVGRRGRGGSARQGDLQRRGGFPAGLVKVGAGSLTVRAPGGSRVVKQGYAVLVFQTGMIKGPESAQFDAKDGLALARLR